MNWGELERLCAVAEQHRSELLALPGVVGVGVGTAALDPPQGGPVIQVFVRAPEAVEEVRARVAGILGTEPVAVIVTGEPRPLEEPP